MEMGIIDLDEFVHGAIKLRIKHKEDQLVWSASEFNKKNYAPEVELFTHINAFWASLSEDRQDRIWGCYKRINEIMDRMSDPEALIQELTPAVKDLYEEHKLEEVSRWLAFHSNISVPSRFEEHYVHSAERPGSREKTYLRSDYVKLVALALVLRPMIPVWGEFINLTKRELGTLYKEHYAFTLLAQTELMTSEPMERLKVYIEHNLKSDQVLTPSIVAGIGTESYVEWLLAALVVNRICVGDIRGHESLPCLVVSSWKYISQTTKASNGSTFGNRIGSKTFSNADGEQEASRLEGYKPKSELAAGDLTPYDAYLRNLKRSAKRLMPDMDMSLLNELKGLNKALKSEFIQDAQITLMQWVIAPVVSARAGFYLRNEPNNPALLHALSLAQTVLWQRGHKKLAVLLTAISKENDDTLQISGLGSMARLTREQVQQLEALYPYTRIPAGKPNTKVVNDAIRAIDLQAERFSNNDWLVTVTPEMLAEAFGPHTQRQVGCPHDIKQCLADLAIQIGSRTLTQAPVVTTSDLADKALSVVQARAALRKA